MCDLIIIIQQGLEIHGLEESDLGDTRFLDTRILAKALKIHVFLFLSKKIMLIHFIEYVVFLVFMARLFCISSGQL